MAVLKNFALCVLVLTEISKNMKLVPDTGEGAACFGQNCYGQKRPLAGEIVVRLDVVRVVFTAGETTMFVWYNNFGKQRCGKLPCKRASCRLVPIL